MTEQVDIAVDLKPRRATNEHEARAARALTAETRVHGALMRWGVGPDVTTNYRDCYVHHLAGVFILQCVCKRLQCITRATTKSSQCPSRTMSAQRIRPFEILNQRWEDNF